MLALAALLMLAPVEAAAPVWSQGHRIEPGGEGETPALTGRAGDFALSIGERADGDFVVSIENNVADGSCAATMRASEVVAMEAAAPSAGEMRRVIEAVLARLDDWCPADVAPVRHAVDDGFDDAWAALLARLGRMGQVDGGGRPAGASR